MLASLGIRALQACRVSSAASAATRGSVIGARSLTALSDSGSDDCPIAGTNDIAATNDTMPITHLMDRIVFILVFFCDKCQPQRSRSYDKAHAHDVGSEHARVFTLSRE